MNFRAKFVVFFFLQLEKNFFTYIVALTFLSSFTFHFHEIRAKWLKNTTLRISFNVYVSPCYIPMGRGLENRVRERNHRLAFQLKRRTRICHASRQETSKMTVCYYVGKKHFRTSCTFSHPHANLQRKHDFQVK